MSSIKSPQEIAEQSLVRHHASGHRICIGLSGGLDSVVLLHLLKSLQDKHALNLSAIHVHHGLSPNADQWQRFCESICAAENIPFKSVNVSIDRNAAGGIEALARAK